MSKFDEDMYCEACGCWHSMRRYIICLLIYGRNK